MLVVSRKKDECVVIGDPDSPDAIQVMVVGVRGQRVLLGIDAPRQIPVRRGEIARAIAADCAVRAGEPTI